MKIIQVVPFFGLGGAEIMCENLTYELKKLGHEVIAVSLYNKKTPITERLEKANIPIRFLDKKDGFDFSIYKKLKSLLKKEKPDVIHTHIYVSKYVFPVASKLKIKVVHTVHSVATKELGKLSRKFNKFYFKYFNVVPVALSKIVQNTIIEEYKLTPSKVPVVLNGIDLTKCQRKKSYACSDKFKIVHIGSFIEVKNHKGLIDAFEIFHSKFPNSELHLIGDGKDKAEIELLVQNKNLSDCVVFYGFQSNVHQYLSLMDVFTLPSLYEGIPMSIAEAMGSGLPIVATAVGGVPDMLDDKSATLVPVDTNAMADAFEKYYLSEELRKAHGLAALKRADRFSAEVMTKQYFKIYNQ